MVNNTATASGTPPTGPAVTATDSDDHCGARRTASLALDKQAGTPSGNTAGSTIAYTFIVTNTGNVTLTSVAVTDPKVGRRSPARPRRWRRVRRRRARRPTR